MNLGRGRMRSIFSLSCQERPLADASGEEDRKERLTDNLHLRRLNTVKPEARDESLLIARRVRRGIFHVEQKTLRNQTRSHCMDALLRQLSMATRRSTEPAAPLFQAECAAGAAPDVHRFLQIGHRRAGDLGRGPPVGPAHGVKPTGQAFG